MGMTHDELKELLAPYALGAVTTEEERAVKSHIKSCEECMREAEGFSGAAASLALAVDEAPVPAGFADAILAQVQSERPEVSSAPAVSWWYRWRIAVAGVAAVSVAATIVLASALVALRGEVRQYESAVPPLVQGEGMTLEGAGGAVARMVPTEDGATFFASGLGEAPDRRTYQLWLMECEDPEDVATCVPTSVGTFDVAGGIAVLETGSSLEGYDRAAVTVEPEGGSEAPTTTPVIISAA